MDQTDSILKGECSGDSEGSKLSQRVSCHHVGLLLRAKDGSGDVGVDEDGRLGHSGLLQLLLRAVEDNFAQTEAEDLICTIKEAHRLGIIIVHGHAHADVLGSLAGKYVC